MAIFAPIFLVTAFAGFALFISDWSLELFVVFIAILAILVSTFALAAHAGAGLALF